MQVSGNNGDLSAGVVSEPISFAESFVNSDSFDALFREGMTLVEETADYLDREGRASSRALEPPLSVIYATESMRMTTRLLEVASWLVVQRALKDGEMTLQEAEAKRAKVKLRRLPAASEIKRFEELPAGLRDLIHRSAAMVERLMQLDAAMRRDSRNAAGSNPVANQMQRIASAFGRRFG